MRPFASSRSVIGAGDVIALGLRAPVREALDRTRCRTLPFNSSRHCQRALEARSLTNINYDELTNAHLCLHQPPYPSIRKGLLLKRNLTKGVLGVRSSGVQHISSACTNYPGRLERCKVSDFEAAWY